MSGNNVEQASAVVLPEHRDADLASPVYGFARGWNACLDEFARLNPATAQVWGAFEEREAQTCLFVMRDIGSRDADEIGGDDVDLRFEDDQGRDTGCDVSIVEYAERTAKVLEGAIAALAAAPVPPVQGKCQKCESETAIETRRLDGAEAVELQRVLFERHRDMRPAGAGLMGWAAIVLGQQAEQVPVALPRVSGIGRDAEHPHSLVLYLGSVPTDDDIRAIQEALRTPPAAPAQDVAGLAEALRELVSGVRSINHGKRHQIKVGDDDDPPCYWQRKEWVDWILELCGTADGALAAYKGGK